MDKLLVFGVSEDSARVHRTAEFLAARGYECWRYALPRNDDGEWIRSNIISDLRLCDKIVFVFSAAANGSDAVVSFVDQCRRSSRRVFVIIFDESRYDAPLDFLLGRLQYERVRGADVDASLERLRMSISQCNDQPRKNPKRKHLLWFAAGFIIIIAALMVWRIVYPKGPPWPEPLFEPVLEAGLEGVAEDLPCGRVVVSVLGLHSGEYVSRGVEITRDGVYKIPVTECEKSFALEEVDASQIIKPILAAISMNAGGASPEVVLSDDMWMEDCKLGAMLSDDLLLSGLSDWRLRSSLKGVGVAPESRRFFARPLRLAIAYGMMAIEASGQMGYGYCGGAERARRILDRIVVTPWGEEDIVTGYAVSQSSQFIPGVTRAVTQHTVGIVSANGPFCVIFVSATFEDDAGVPDGFDNESEIIWHTIAAVATLQWTKVSL